MSTHPRLSNRRLQYMTRRSFVKALGLTAGGALLGACAGDDTQAPAGENGQAATGQPANGEAATEVALDWSFWASFPAEREVWEEIQEDVNAEHPSITLNLDTVAFGDYWDRLLTQLASGTQADIIGMQAQRLPGFAARGALRPLNELLEQDDIAYDDFFEPIQNALSWEGDVFALAYDLGPPIIFYNQQIFEEAGIDFPSPDQPMSWDDFRGIARELTNPDENRYGFSIAPNFDWAIPFIWSAGGNYMNEEETESLLHEPEAIEGIRFLDQMITEDGSVFPITDLGSPQIAQEAFMGGNSAMHLDGPWSIVAYRGNVDFVYDLAPFPAGDAGSQVWVAGSGFGISPETEHPDEAWEALKVIVSVESLEKVARAGRGYPARESSVPAFEIPDEPPENFQVTEQVLNSETGQSQAYRATTNWQETIVMLEREFNPIFLGGRNVEEILANQIKPLFDDLLQEHQQLIQG